MIINEKKNGTPYARSSLEKQFEWIWLRNFPEIDLVAEAILVPERRFRCDYCHLKSRTVIEIHGSQFGKSSHKGSVKDADKQNALVLLGYSPFILWTSMVNLENIKMIGGFIKSSG
jgi:hypothetical protein